MPEVTRLETQEKIDELSNVLYENMNRMSAPDYSILAFFQRLLLRYNLKPRHNEELVLGVVYERAYKKIQEGQIIRNLYAWIRSVAFRFIHELSRKHRSNPSPLRSTEDLSVSCDTSHRKAEWESIFLDSILRKFEHIKETIGDLASPDSNIDSNERKGGFLDCSRFLRLMNNFLASLILMTLPIAYRDEAIFCFWNSEERKTIMLAFSYLLGGLDYRFRKTMMSPKFPIMR